jgi:hypothetical protein
MNHESKRFLEPPHFSANNAEGGAVTIANRADESI